MLLFLFCWTPFILWHTCCWKQLFKWLLHILDLVKWTLFVLRSSIRFLWTRRKNLLISESFELSFAFKSDYLWLVINHVFFILLFPLRHSVTYNFWFKQTCNLHCLLLCDLLCFAYLPQDFIELAGEEVLVVLYWLVVLCCLWSLVYLPVLFLRDLFINSRGVWS